MPQYEFQNDDGETVALWFGINDVPRVVVVGDTEYRKIISVPHVRGFEIMRMRDEYAQIRSEQAEDGVNGSKYQTDSSWIPKS